MPRITTHPGEVLREEFIAPMGLSVHGLAMALHVPATRLQAIVSETRGVTADTALRLGRYFGTTAQFWMNLQTSYELSAAEQEKGTEIVQEVRPREFA